MANAKKIVGIILLVIGVIMIISGIISGIPEFRIPQIILGVFLFVIGLVFPMASRKKISAANAKKIVGIILLAIGLFFIISEYYIRMLMLGVILSIIGLILLLTSRKNANAKKIVGIILLGIGAVLSIPFGILISRGGSYFYWFVGPTIMGVVLFVIGLILLITSRKKNSKSQDKSIT